MATGEADFMEGTPIEGVDKMKFGIVVSEWNSGITGKLLDGCRETLKASNVPDDGIEVVHVPGSFELPSGARILAARDKFNAIICLGCVIKGETKHDEYISQATANGIMQLSIMMGIPVVFGVLTPNSQQQAEERAGGKYGNKGAEAAVTAMRMALLKNDNKDSSSKIGFRS